MSLVPVCSGLSEHTGTFVFRAGAPLVVVLELIVFHQAWTRC